LEPDAAALAQTMLRVVRKRQELNEKAQLAVERAATWSWERSGARMRERIDALRKI